MSDGIEVRPWTDEDRAWTEERMDRLFGGRWIVSRGRVHHPLELSGFAALLGGDPTGVATYAIEDAACEIVTLDSLVQWKGVGTALLQAVAEAAREAGCERLWLVTTNDNVDALRFYQRRGFRLAAAHAGAIERSRMLKPTIPETGHYGIPIRDELELEKTL